MSITVFTNIDCRKIDSVLATRATHKDYINYRNILMMRLYMHCNMPLSKLLSMRTSHLVEQDGRLHTQGFTGAKISNGRNTAHSLYDFPIEKIQDDILRFFTLRESSSFIFHDAETISNATPEGELISFVKGVLAESKIDLIKKALKLDLREDEILFLHEGLFPDNIPQNSILDGVSDLKDYIQIEKITKEAIKKPYDKPHENIKYTCSECGGIGICSAKSIRQSVQTITQRNGRCLDCINKATEKSIADSAKRTRERKRKVKAEREYRRKTDEVFAKQEAYRENAKKEASKKLKEKTTFYNHLGLANREIEASKVRVYGQGRTEFMRTKGSSSDKKWKTSHVDSSMTEAERFDKDLMREVSTFIHSAKGKAMGMTSTDYEELYMLSNQAMVGDRALTPRECVHKAVGE